MTTLLALVLTLVLPGLAGGVLLASLSDDPSRGGVLLSRSLASGASAWLISSGLLVRTVGVSATSSWVVSAVLGALSVVVLALPVSRRIFALAWRELIYGIALTGLTLLTWLPIAVLNFRTTWTPLGPTPWYYWGLAEQIAKNGHVPANSIEFGIKVPFLNDYHLFSTSTAALLEQTTGNGMRAVHAMIVVTVILVGCGSALLANALGAGRLCSLLAVPVAIGTSVTAVKLSSYRPEVFGIGLAFLVAACGVEWLKRRDRGALVAGGLCAAMLAEVHGLVLMIAAALLVGCALAFVPGLRRRVLLAYLRDVVIIAVAWIGATVVLAVVMDAKSGTEHVGGLDNVSGIADPTWRFIRAIRGLPPSQPLSNSAMANDAIRSSFYGLSPWWFGALVLVTVLIIVVAAVRQASARRVLAVAVVFTLCVAALAAFFAFGWSSYVPRRTGAQRLIQDGVILLGPLTAYAVSRLRRPRITLRGRAVVAGVALVVLTAAGYQSSATLEPLVAAQKPSRHVVSALSQLHIPAGSTVLANAYTEGYLAHVLGANGLLEGRAPYTFPDVLARANSLLQQAALFYRNPAAHLNFLSDEHVNYVLIARVGTEAAGTGNVFYFPVSRAKFAKISELTPVLTMRDVIVYRVNAGAGQG